MLQNFIFIPIDIFLEKLHNNGIQSELDAWLTFLSCDEPEYIIRLIQNYPYFKPMYDDLFNMCLNIERMVHMFSKELQILDHNTVKYMIDELQEQLDAAKEQLDAAKEQLNTASTEISEKDHTIKERDDTIRKKDEAIKEKDEAISNKDKTIIEQNNTIANLIAEIEVLKNKR